MSIPASIKVVIDPSDIPTIAGKSAFEEWLEQPGNSGLSFADFMDELRGPPGAGGGAIKSSVSTLDVSNPTTSSSSFVSTGVNLSITPDSSNSKIMGFVSGIAGVQLDGNLIDFTVVRSVGGVETDIKPAGVAGIHVIRGRSSGASDFPHSFSFGFEDAPGTTSNVTYSLHWRTYNNCVCYLGRRHYNDGSNATSKATTFMRLDDVGA